MNIAIIVNEAKKDALKHTVNVMTELLGLDATILMTVCKANNFSKFSITFCENQTELISKCDVLIAIGGDGTIIDAAKCAALQNKPVLGINVGRLGYVAGLETNELYLLKDLVTGNYKTEARMMLEVTYFVDGKPKVETALNDAVLSRGSLAHILDFTVFYHGRPVCDYRADGLIVATPTGSSAYSFAAGGPVVDPIMKCILLTAICPHSDFARTVLFERDSDLTMKATSIYESDMILTVDGDCVARLEDGARVQVRESPFTAKLIKLKYKNFYEVAREKLGERGK